jgi:biopolymer transport protein ExbB
LNHAVVMEPLAGLMAQLAMAQAETPAPQASSKTLLDYLIAGGPVGLMLILLSILGLALIIVHMVQARLAALAPADIVLRLEQTLKVGDIPATLAICDAKENECFLTRVIASGIRRCSRSAIGFLEIRSAIEDAGVREVERLSRVTDALGLIAAVGPMLGLLGTVFGMIGAFTSISELEGAARSRELAGFMSLALVTTAMGLGVAIPCTIVWSLARRRVERLAGEVGEIAEGLATLIENKSDAPRPAPAARAPQAAAAASASRVAPPRPAPVAGGATQP